MGVFVNRREESVDSHFCKREEFCIPYPSHGKLNFSPSRKISLSFFFSTGKIWH